MPLSFAPTIVDGKVYRSKKKQHQQDKEDEEQAFKELQLILSKKNRKPCDCEAQIHYLVENCLNCGRLTCTFEGPGKCLFCGSIILSQAQRSKLSKFIDIVNTNTCKSSNSNRQQSSSSRIIDNQTIDHFMIDNKKHLKESEKKMLKETLEELQSKRHQRKLVFEVDVDNMEAGSRSTGLIDDYEAELRMLQLADNSGPIESNICLAELVHRESKKNYLFEYVEPIVDKKKLTQQSKQIESQESNKDNLGESNESASNKSNYGPQSKPNKNYEYKSNHKHNRNRSKNTFKKTEPNSGVWNKSKKLNK